MRNTWQMVGLLALFLQACAVPGPKGPFELRGAVAFGSTRHIQAASQEIGTAATVSLIDPSTSRTIATTLTQPDRSFTLTIAGFTPQPKTYFLEAIKGLNSNAAGFDAARLRTLVRWSETHGWQALTTGDASLTFSTTALAAIVGLRAAYVAVDPGLLIGKLDLTKPDPFDEAGTGVSQAEFDTVKGLVAEVIGQDRDALDALQYNGSVYSLKRLTSPAVMPFISRLIPNPVSAGSELAIDGGNFREPSGENVITLNGLPVTILSGDTDSLLVRLPANATSGPLQLSNPEGVATSSLTITPAIDGGVLPSTTSAPISNGPGTDIPGSVFGR